jgi:excinuclease ABC subunit C
VILNPDLRDHVRHYAEDRPGVYRMMGPDREVLYVGKSIRVKSRLLSYFRASPREKAGKLIQNTFSVQWDYVPNEFAALLTELRLIKRWRPRYNVEHKRKRSFAFIKVTREPAPRILPVGRVSPDGATYFGPFPRPRLLALTLGELAHALGLRDCAGTIPVVFGDQTEIFREGPRPRCIRAETGSCMGPCNGGCLSSEYQRGVETARRFLEGKTREPLRILRDTMERAAAGLEFEYAALLRDRLHRLETLQRELVAFRGRVEGLSFVYRVPGFRGDDRLYLIRKGLVAQEIPIPSEGRERASAVETIQRVFGEAPTEPHGLSQKSASEILLVARWFRLREREMDRVWHPDEWIRIYGSI